MPDRPVDREDKSIARTREVLVAFLASRPRP